MERKMGNANINRPNEKKSLTKVISPPLGSFWFLITDLLKGENIF